MLMMEFETVCDKKEQKGHFILSERFFVYIARICKNKKDPVPLYFNSLHDLESLCLAYVVIVNSIAFKINDLGVWIPMFSGVSPKKMINVGVILSLNSTER